MESVILLSREDSEDVMVTKGLKEKVDASSWFREPPLLLLRRALTI